MINFLIDCVLFSNAETKLKLRENSLGKILQDLIMKMLQKEDGRKIKGISHIKILIESITCSIMMNLMLFSISSI